MIYLVVRLTYVPGKAADGSEYEHTVMPYFVEHGGEIIAAFKPLAQADGLPRRGRDPDPSHPDAEAARRLPERPTPARALTEARRVDRGDGDLRSRSG